jgi:2-polyprenyl-3-methyl-5-hydroxy-6-metoxy-1,4-benzoquinol methylase
MMILMIAAQLRYFVSASSQNSKSEIGAKMATINVGKNSNASAEWNGSTLVYRCECELCASNEEIRKLHSNNTHNQQLFTKFCLWQPNLSIEEDDNDSASEDEEFKLKYNLETVSSAKSSNDNNVAELNLSGGTTKCARVFLDYLQDQAKFFYNNSQQHSVDSGIKFNAGRACELGSGSGVVGIYLARLGCSVTVTDQSPVLPSLQQNVYNNMSYSSPNSQAIQVQELLWGDVESANKLGKFDIIIGSDLIFAVENNPALVQTYKLLAHERSVCYLAYIARFSGEKDFFTGMNQYFTSKLVHSVDEIEIWRFNPK